MRGHNFAYRRRICARSPDLGPKPVFNLGEMVLPRTVTRVAHVLRAVLIHSGGWPLGQLC